MEKRKALADFHDPHIKITRQAELLSVNRSSLYRKKALPGWSQTDLMHMRLIDKIYTAHPFYGYRRITAALSRLGHHVNRKRVQRLMRIMDIRGICPGKNLSKCLHAQYVRPYLLRQLKIERPNQVWVIDISYIRMQHGFMYLFVILDVYSRYIIDYAVSPTLDRYWCHECLRQALKKHKPEIINSDQGSQWTNEDYIQLLQAAGVKVSMDGKGRALDNIFVERFFRSVKYELIYLNEYDTPKALRQGLAQYMQFYNEQRPHMALEYRCPAELYQNMTVSIAS